MRTRLSAGGFACLAGYYFYAYIFFNRLFFAPGGSFHFHPVFIQIALLLCAAVLLVCLRGRSSSLRPSARACLAVGILVAAATALDSASFAFDGFSQLAVQFLACILFGLGFVLYTLLWTQVYEALDFPRLLCALASAFVLSTLVRSLTFVDLHDQPAWRLVFCAVMAASLAMLNRAWVRQRREGLSGETATWRLSRALFSTLKGPFVAVATVAFCVGVTWGEAATVGYAPVLAVVSALLTGVVCALLGRAAEAKPSLRHAFFGSVFPLSTILLLASLLWGQLGEGGAAAVAVEAAYYVGLAFFEVCIFAALVVVSQNNGVSASVAILVKFVVYGAAFTAGKAVSSLAGNDALFGILTAALLLYLAFNVVVLAVDQVVDAAHASVPVHAAISDRAAERFGLTPREKEVLSCLLEGRSYEGIGRRLFISSSTVKTHVKHIYEKAGVKNRDELIDLVF